MRTIYTRPSKDGSVSDQAQVFIRHGCQIVHLEVQTIDRKQAASAWLEKRESDLAQPGGLQRAFADDPPLGDIIGRYVDESLKAIGRTKAQVLNAIKTHDIAFKKASSIKSADIVGLAKMLSATRAPQTVANYLSHLGAVFAIARPAWGYPLDPQTMKDAFIVCKRLGLTGKSKEWDRRPTLDELDTILTHYTDRQIRRPSQIPMTLIIPFAIFSTRRQEEMVSIRWSDLDEKHYRVLVRDMKNPGEKIGNNVWCDLTPEAFQVILAMPRTSDRIFPFTTDAISADRVP